MSVNQITIKSKKSVDDFGELNRLTEALVFIDEIYRLMKKPEVIEKTKKIDFRRKEYKEIEGAKLASFKVNSPPEITIIVDNAWIGALSYVLVNYKTIKENISELASDSHQLIQDVTELTSDSNQLIQGITELTKQEIENIQAGIRLLHSQLENLTKKDIDILNKKIHYVRSKINIESIKEIIVKRYDNT